MPPTIPAEDTFDQGVALLPRPLEYLRGGYAGPYGDADPHLVYDAGDGFARFEDGAETLALYRRISADAIRAKVRFMHKRVSGTAGATRYTGVIVRAVPSGVTASPTSGQTDYFTGISKGYLARVEDDGTPAVGLYQINGSVLVLIASAAVALAEDTWHTLEARVQTNASGNPEIVVLLNGATVSGMAPHEDSTAGKVVVAGMVGLQGRSVNAGGEEVRAIFDYFQAVSFDGAEVLLEDDFQRPSLPLVTAGGKVHAALMWEFGDAQQISGATGSTMAPGYLGNTLAVEPGTPAAGFIGPWVDLYQRTPAGADQAAGIRFMFSGSSANALHSVGVALRGVKSAAGTGTANFTGYVLRARMASGGVNALTISRFNAGTETLLASRNWTYQPDKWYTIDCEGEVDGADYVLTIRQGLAILLRVRDTTPLVAVGLLGVFGRMTYANGAAGVLLVDKWYATSAPTPGTIEVAPVIDVDFELGVRHEYLEDQVREWAQVRFPFETRHAQTYPAMRQGVIVWTAEWLCEEPDASTVYDFLIARSQDAQPFLLHASTGDKAMLLVSQEIPFEGAELGLYRIGPVQMIEYIAPDSTP